MSILGRTSVLGRVGQQAAVGLVAILAAGSCLTSYAAQPDKPTTSAAVVLAIDNSGSYTVPRRQEWIPLGDAVGLHAQVAVVVFDTTARVALQLGEISSPERRAAFDSAVASVNGQGQNTVLNTGLGTAVELLSGIDSAKVEPQIIFFTDGISDPPRHLDHDSLSRDWERLVTACVAARLRVSAVCPPGKAGLPSMEALASATGGLCIVTHEPAKVVGAVLPATSAEQGLRPSTDRTPLANVRVRQRRSMFLLVVLLVLAAAGVGVPVLLGGRAFRRRLQSPSGRGTKEGLAGIAEAVAQLRALAAEFGEPGARIRELAATIEAAGCTTFTEQREAGERMRKLLGEVLSVRDEVEDILSGIGTGDARARESLEFVDELLAKVLAADKIKEMVVVVGSLYDGSLHEPRPERNSAARGTILRIERRGYIIQQKVDAPKVLRFAKVVVSDGSGMKEA